MRSTSMMPRASRPRSAAGRTAVVCAIAAVVVAVLVVVTAGTAVTPLAADAPATCRPVTLFAVAGRGAGTPALAAVTDPLLATHGAKLDVVAVPPPDTARAAAAVDGLAAAVTGQAAACPQGRVLLLGWSEGAQVAGDLAARIGAGQVTGVPAARVAAVGLFGDPARGPSGRVVPADVPGRGVLPARGDGFGDLAARTIEICAPDDPVCASPPDRRAPSLAQALAAPAHARYAQLSVAPNLTATQWAAQSLGRVVDAVPATPATTTAATTTPATTTSKKDRPRSSRTAESTSEPTSEPTSESTSESTSEPTSERSAPSRTSAPAAAAGLLLDSTVGDLASHFDNGGGNGLVQGGQKPRVVADPLDPARQVFAFTVPGGAKRSEVLPKGAQNFRAGQHVVFSYAASLAPGFPVDDANDFQVVWQLHDGGTNVSPPVALEVKKGQLWLTASGSGRSDQPLGPVTAGQPFAVQLEITFALGGGSVSAWRDGKQMLAAWKPPRGTMIDDHDYLKVGLYRSESIRQDGTVFLRSLRIGPSLDAVGGATGPTP